MHQNPSAASTGNAATAVPFNPFESILSVSSATTKTTKAPSTYTVDLSKTPPKVNNTDDEWAVQDDVDEAGRVIAYERTGVLRVVRLGDPKKVEILVFETGSAINFLRAIKLMITELSSSCGIVFEAQSFEINFLRKINSNLESCLHPDNQHEYLTTKAAFDELLVILKDFSDLQTQGLLLKIQFFIITTMIKQKQIASKVLNQILSGIGSMMVKIDQDQLGVTQFDLLKNCNPFLQKICSTMESLAERKEFSTPEYKGLRPLAEKLGHQAKNFKQKYFTDNRVGHPPETNLTKGASTIKPSGSQGSAPILAQTIGNDSPPKLQPSSSQQSVPSPSSSPNPFVTLPLQPQPDYDSGMGTNQQSPILDMTKATFWYQGQTPPLQDPIQPKQPATSSTPRPAQRSPKTSHQCVHSAGQLAAELGRVFLGLHVTSTHTLAQQVQRDYNLQQMLSRVCLATLLQACDQLNTDQLSRFIENAREFGITSYEGSKGKKAIRRYDIPRFFSTVKQSILAACEQHLASGDHCLYSVKQITRCWTQLTQEDLRENVITKLREQQPLGNLQCSDYTLEEAITLAGTTNSLGYLESNHQKNFLHLCLFNVLYNQPTFLPELLARVPGFRLVPFLTSFYERMMKLPSTPDSEQFIVCLINLEEHIQVADPSDLEKLSIQLMKFYKSLVGSYKDDQMLKLQLIKDPSYPKFWRNSILAHLIKKSTNQGSLWGLLFSGNGKDLDKNIILNFIKEGFSKDKYKVMEAFLSPDGDSLLERLSFVCQLSKSDHSPSKLFVEKIMQDQIALLLEIQREDIYFEKLERVLEQRGKFNQIVDRIFQLKTEQNVYCPGGLPNKDTLQSKLAEADKNIKAIQQVESQMLAIINNQRFKVFQKINTTDLKTTFDKYYQKSFLKMRDIRSIKQAIDPLPNLLRATELLIMGEFYELRIEQTLDELFPGRGLITPKEMDLVCQNTEAKLATMLKNSCVEIQKKHMSELKRLRKVLEVLGDSNPLIKCNLITEEQRSNILVLIKLLSLVDEYQPIKRAYDRIEKTLQKVGYLPKSAKTDSLLSRVMNTINTMQDGLKNSASVPISNLGFFQLDERRVISLLEQDIGFFKGLGDCITLLDHFISKTPRHFQELLFESDPSMKIGPKHINSLQTLKDLATAFKNKSGSREVVHFYEECLRLREDISVDDLRDKSKELIQASKEFEEGNYDGRKSAFRILKEDSTMVFELDLLREDYQVYCLLKCQFDGETNFKPGSQREKVSLDQMKDSKTKVSLYKQSLPKNEAHESDMLAVQPKRSEKAADLERINTFEKTIEGVIRIHKALVNICRSGTVYNLSFILRGLAYQNLQELEPALNLMRENELSLRIQTQQAKNGPSQKNHFSILAEALESVEKEVANQLFNSNLQYHNITNLKSNQRIMLCRYLENCDHPEQSFGLQEKEALVLVNYMLNTHKITSEQLQLARESVGGDQSRRGWTISCLRDFIAKVSIFVPGFKPKMIQEPRMLNPGKAAAVEVARVQIKYLVSDWTQQYSTIFKLVTAFGERKLAHYQIYFGTSKTHSFEIEHFLIRALTDPDKKLYILIDTELAPHEILIRMLEQCKSLLNTGRATNPNLHIVLTGDRDGSNRKGDLVANFSKYSEFFVRENLTTIEGENLYSKDYLRRLVGNYTILTSQLAGLGKSTEIARQSTGVQLVTVFLSGDVYSQSNCNRLEVIADECQTKAPFNLHIKLDMMDNMLKSCRYLDQFLFSLVYLRCVPFGRTFIFLDKMQICFVEVQNSYRDYLLREVKMLGFGERRNIPNLTEADFRSNFDISLWPDELQSKLKLVTVFWDSKKNGTFGLTNFDPNDARYLPQNNLIELLLEALRSCVEPAKVNRFFLNLTYREVQHWVSSCEFQIRGLMEVPGLDPQRIEATNDRAVAQQLSDIRIKTGQKTLELTHRLVWGVAAAIREESNRAQQLADYNQRNHQAIAIDQKELDEYSDMVKKIPPWGMGQQVNYFFYQSVFKVLYPNLASVDTDVKLLVKRFTNKDLIDYSQQPPTVLLEHLMEALGLINDPRVIAEARNYEDDEIRNIGNLSLKVCRYMEKRSARFNKKGYIITHDNLTKILMIIQRAELCMPIVIMGATGCGKTYMINYIASCLLGQIFECFTLHSGVTEEMLIEKLEEVQTLALDCPSKVWLLFDEFNTSPLQCLISEIMIERRCTFSNRLKHLEFPDNLVFVAACNPYRIKPNTSAVGLIHESSSRILAHRVYPIPQTLINCIFDFGQLSSDAEKEYIKSLVTCGSKISSLPNTSVSLVVQLVHEAQSFFRKCGCENAVSLRDVNRFLEFVDFGMKVFKSEQDALALATHICYVFRLEEKPQRKLLIDTLEKSTSNKYKLGDPFLKLVLLMKQELEKMEVVPEGISLNKALMENLMALWACISTQTPIIFCGKPGTSKTLAIRIFTDSLELWENRLSTSVFFKHTPRVHFRNFWGSTTTTSDKVTQIFAQCLELGTQMRIKGKTQENAGSPQDKREAITCLVFDEIGLAEIADDNPLKVLHPLLEPIENKIAFVGLSNWRLDLSKMNRMVYVARPDMDCEDLLETCQIGDLDHSFKPLVERTLKAFAQGYFEFRRKEVAEQDPMSHPNFHGSRDFYEAVKIFTRNLKAITTKNEKYRISNDELCNKLMINAIHRCFSGKNYKSVISHRRMVEEYKKQMGSTNLSAEEPNSIDLVYQNLLDPKSRHLMILSSMGFVQESIIEQIREFEITKRKKDPSKFEILSRTKDREDLLSVIQSKLPVFISQGYTIVMKNLDELYGSMYDLLNQNYSKRLTTTRRDKTKPQTATEMMMDEGRSVRTQAISDTDEEQVEEFTCDLFIDGTSRAVPVHPEFKCIILMEELEKQNNVEEVERRQQPPFLNRFEKYLIREQDFLTPESIRAKERLLKDYQLDNPGKSKASSALNPHAIVHNLSKELVISMVVEDSSEVKKRLQFHSDSSSIVSILGLDSNSSNSRRSGQAAGASNQVISLSDTINKKMLRLHSRNGILAFLQNVGSINLPADYLELFYQTHPHNTLHEFSKHVIQAGTKRLSIVFTYSTSLELRQFVEAYSKDYSLIEVLEFQTEFLQRPRTCFEDVLLKASKANKTLIVQFTKKSDWPMIQQLRVGFEQAMTTSSYSKPVIFVAQYMLGDFKHQGSDQGSGITYLNDKWEMVVIDDINGSEYKQFADSLQASCSDERYTQNIGLLLKEGLRHHVLMKTNVMSTLARAQNTLKFISSCSQLSAALSNGTIKVVQAMNKPILTLFNRQFSKYFDEHLDAKSLIQSKVDQLYLTEMDKLLTDFDNYVSLDSLFLLSHLSETHLEQLRSVVNNRATSLRIGSSASSIQNQRATDQVGTTLSKTDVMMFPLFKFLKYDHPQLSKELDRDAREAINRLGALPENPAGNEIEKCLVSIKSQAKQKFREFSTKMMKIEAKDLPTSPQIHQMVAILLFHQHLSVNQPQMTENPIFEIIVEMGLKFVEATRKPDDDLADLREFLILLILICKIYHNELHVLAFYSTQLVEQRATQLAALQAIICKSFLTKGRIDLTEYIRSIQALEQITGENTVQSQIRRLELSYKLTRMVNNKSGSSVPRNPTPGTDMVTPRSSHPHDEVFLDHHIVIAILKQVCLAKDERIMLVQVYNQTLNSWNAAQVSDMGESARPNQVRATSNMRFSGFALHFLQGCATERRFGLKTLRSLVKCCWGYLLELDSLDPLTYFERICNILMTIISKQLVSKPVTTFPTDQDIFGLSYLAKLIIFNYRAYATRGFNQEVSLGFFRTHETHFQGQDPRLFYLLLNYKMMCIAFTNLSDFQQLNTRNQLNWQQVQQCLDTIRLTINRQQQPGPLSYDHVRALCMLKSCVRAIRERSPLSTGELVGVFDDMFEPQRQAQLDPALANHLLHCFYTEMQSLGELKRLGMNRVAAKILTFSASSDQAFLIPDNQQMNAAKQAVDEIVMGGRPTTDPSQLLRSLNLRLEITNRLLGGAVQESLTNFLQVLPQNQLLRDYIQTLMSPTGRGPAGPPSPLHLSLAAVISMMDILPPASCYSSTRPGQSVAGFTPMLNYPAREVLRLMPVMQFSNVARGATVNNQAVFTALWECTSPNCGFLVPIGDCGQLGHMGSTNISTTCPGCRKQIGQLGNGRDPGLRKLNLDQVKAQYDRALATDETPYRPEQIPQGTAQRFDESWILGKYAASIKHRTTAIFISLIQNMILFGLENLARQAGQRFRDSIPLPEQSTNLAVRLIQRDFRLLREALGRDEQAIFEITCLVIYQVIAQYQTNPTQLGTAAQMRQLLAQTFDQIGLPGPGNTAPRMLEDYYQRKRAVQTGDETVKQNRKMMALLSGRMPMEEIRAEYKGKEEQIFGLLLNRTSAAITVPDVVTKLECIARETPEAAAECEFLIHVVNNPEIVSRLRGIISGVKRFSALLANKFDSKLTKAQAATKTMEQIMTEDQEIRREFDTFCQLLNNQVLKDGPIQEMIRENFRFECEAVNQALEQIRSLTKEKTFFAYFVVYDERSADDAPPLVQMLLTTLLAIQEKWITKFGELAKSRAAPSGFHVKNLFSSTDESVMHINSELLELDLIRHSQVEAVAMTVNGTLTTDYRFLVHKYAEQLFGEAQLLRVEPNISFSDSKKNDLGVLIRKFYARYPHIKPEEDPDQVVGLRYSTPQQTENVKTVLKLMLGRLLSGSYNLLTEERNLEADLSGNSTLLDLILGEENDLVSRELACEIRLKDLKIIFIDQASDSNLANFEEIKGKVKQKFRSIKGLEGTSAIKTKMVQVDEQTKETWINALKVAFTKAVNDDSLARETIKQQLEYQAEESLEEIDWKPVLACLTRLGIPTDKFNLIHILDLVDLLQSS